MNSLPRSTFALLHHVEGTQLRFDQRGESELPLRAIDAESIATSRCGHNDVTALQFDPEIASGGSFPALARGKSRTARGQIARLALSFARIGVIVREQFSAAAANLNGFAVIWMFKMMDVPDLRAALTILAGGVLLA